jgi:hypothetical protein
MAYFLPHRPGEAPTVSFLEIESYAASGVAHKRHPVDWPHDRAAWRAPGLEILGKCPI